MDDSSIFYFCHPITHTRIGTLSCTRRSDADCKIYPLLLLARILPFLTQKRSTDRKKGRVATAVHGDVLSKRAVATDFPFAGSVDSGESANHSTSHVPLDSFSHAKVFFYTSAPQFVSRPLQ